MSEFIKKRVIKDLIEELSDIGSVELEIVGHKIIETVEKKALIHHGINKDYRPVGYTVDTFSQDMSVIGEYSTALGYFDDSSGRKDENRFDKIENDVKHALEKAGDVAPAKIYLVSSKSEPESFRGKFAKTDLFKEHRERLNFLDARELAKVIFQSSHENSSAADFYGYYLPDFKQNLDNYEYYGRIPSACAHHRPEPKCIEAINHHFAAGSEICVLHGLSGSGKTQAAIEFVRSALDKFGNYVWIAGNDWEDGVPLSAVRRSRGGVAINVAGVFNSTRTLLIVDNLNRPISVREFADLAAGFAIGGRVLVTSQLGQPGSPIHVLIPRLSPTTAYQILGEDETASNDTCRKFVEACRFSPLILAVTREIGNTDGITKEELYREVLDDPNTAYGEDGSPIMGRVLHRLTDTNRQGLVKIANSGSTTFDSRFLTKYIGAGVRTSLQRLALINRNESSSDLTVHDLICRAIHERDDSSILADAIEDYVAANSGEMVPSVVRQIHLSSKQLLIADELRGTRNADWLTYAILQVERAGRDERYAPLQGLEVRGDMPLAELKCIVDSKEYHSYTLQREDRLAYYEACAAQYGDLARTTSDPEVRAEMLHHQGKALRRCGQPEAAMACFNQLLSEKPEWHATYGQIAHVGSQRDADSRMREHGEEAIRQLFEYVLNDSSNVPLRVSLAALSRLRSYPKIGDELGQHPAKVERLAEVVALSALDGFDQFYEAFLALTSVFLYHHPRPCLDLAEAFPDMLAIAPSSVDERHWGNVCEGLINIAKSAEYKEKRNLANRVRDAAIVFAKELSKGPGEDQFLARLLAKTFLALGEKEAALAAALRIPTDARDHWLLYQESKVELAMDRYGDALGSAERALALAKEDPKASRRLAIYHEQIGLALQAAGRLHDAIEATKTAVDLANGFYKASLEKRLETLIHKLK